MKKISLILAFVLSLQLFGAVSAYAKADSEQTFYYDFTDYVKPTAIVEEPGAWGANHGSGATNSGRWAWTVENVDANPMIKAAKGGEPILYFGEIFKTGKLHISFDLKVEGEAGGLIGMYDGRSNATEHYVNDDPYYIPVMNDVYSNMISVGATGCSIYYYDGKGGADMTSWKANLPKYEKDMTEWRHIDFFFDEISATTSRANYYVDGELINSSGVSFSKSSGFKGLFFRQQNNGNFYIDNVYVHRYYDEEEGLGVAVKNNGIIDNEVRELEVAFSEPVEGTVTTEDITVIRELDGYEISDITLLETTDRSVKIKINEELQAGLYNIMVGGVSGKFTSSQMTKSKQFRTAYRTATVQGEIFNENFNTYSTADGVTDKNWPTGWITDTTGTLTNPSVRSVTGASGEVDDYAFGMELTSASIRRPIYELSQAISVEDELSISFDVKTTGSVWAIQLLDDSMDNSRDNDNSVIGMTAGDFKLKYAPETTSGLTTAVDDAFVLQDSVWHNVSVTIKPETSSLVNYAISLDGATPVTVTSTRNYKTRVIDRIAINFKGEASATHTFAIDNLKIKSNINALHPEVDTITLIDNHSNEYYTSEVIPIEITDVKIKFNTGIYEENIDNVISFVDESGNSVDCEKSFNADKDILTYSLQEPLNSRTTYKISISDQLASAVSEEIKSDVFFAQSFTTERNDGMYEVYNNQFNLDDVNNTLSYSLEIAKTDNSVNQYIMAIAGYKIVTSDGKDYEELVETKLTPIDLTADARGYFIYGAQNKINSRIDEFTEYDKIKAYVFKYPSMQLVSVEER